MHFPEHKNNKPEVEGEKKSGQQRPHSDESASSSCTKSNGSNNNEQQQQQQRAAAGMQAGTHKSKKFAVNSRINLLTFGSSVAKRKKNKSTKFQHAARGVGSGMGRGAVEEGAGAANAAHLPLHRNCVNVPATNVGA